MLQARRASQNGDDRKAVNTTYSILDGNSNETVIVSVDNGAQVLVALPLAIAPAMDPY